MKKILVPTDFSDNALRAATYAAELATRSKASICLLYVLEPTEAVLFRPATVQEKYSYILHDNRQKELLAFKKNVSDLYPALNITTAIVEGDAKDTIPHYCRSEGYDLIIMGTRGASGAKEFFLGSTTAAVIARATTSVLAIPDEYALQQPDALVLATNHFEENPELLSTLAELAYLFTAPVHVVVYVEKDSTDAQTVASLRKQLEAYVQYLQSQFPGVAFKSEVIEGTDFEGALQLYSIRQEVSIIGMVTYPKKFFDRIFHRSATQKMTFHSHIPVLAIPAAAAG